MFQPKTYIQIICVLLVVKLLSMCYHAFNDEQIDDNYQTECVMHDPSTPVEYESRYYNGGPVYIVTYEGRTRWNGEKCTERECVNVTEYRRTKSIVGEQK